MNRSELRDLLGFASAFDGRSVTDEAVEAWYEILRPFHLDQAMQAVKNHFSTSDRKLMPFHVVDGVRKIREEVMRDFQSGGQPLEIPDADPDDTRAYLQAVREQRSRHADGHQVPVGKMIESLGERMASSRPSFREPTPMVVSCSKCSALVGRPCRTSTYRDRAPHEERLESFASWRAQRSA